MSDNQNDTQAENTHKGGHWRKTLLSWVTSLGIGVVFFLAIQALQVETGKSAFEKTGIPIIPIEQALKESEVRQKPVLINFSAYWCSTCRQVDRSVLTSPKVQQALKDEVVFSRMEFGEPGTEEWMAFYNIHSYPTFLLVDQSGNVLQKLPVTANVESFLNNLKRAKDTIYRG